VVRQRDSHVRLRMSELVPALTDPPDDYGDWLTNLKCHIRTARQRAAVVVNTELVRFV
jgi:hypothetical protein